MSVDELEKRLRELRLSEFLRHYSDLAIVYEQKNKSCIDYLTELVDREMEGRYHRRIDRLLKQAKIPRSKTLQSFDTKQIGSITPSQIKRWAEGQFIDRQQNLLIFGNPGTGKTHLCLALVEQWCLMGRRVYYATAAELIEKLLQAKSELKLDRLIKKLDRYEVLVIDDISYIPCQREETDVLFTLLSARYEMRSLVITSNLAFGQWGQIFKDEMTTQAAIDRLVHHGIIIELNGESYRMKTAQKNKETEVNE